MSDGRRRLPRQGRPNRTGKEEQDLDWRELDLRGEDQGRIIVQSCDSQIFCPRKPENWSFTILRIMEDPKELLFMYILLIYKVSKIKIENFWFKKYVFIY